MSEQTISKPLSGKSVLRQKMIRLFLAALFLSLALAGSLLSVCTLGRTVYGWKGFEIELRLMPSVSGQTRVELVPLGEIHAHTHNPPVALIASLKKIKVEELQNVIEKPLDADSLSRDFKKVARASLQDFVLRQLALGALGGLLAPVLFHSRRSRIYVGASVAGSLGVGLVLGSALTTFNGKAFENPAYTGALRHAAWAIKFGKDAFTKFEELSGQFRTIAQNLNTLYGRIDAVSNTLLPDEGADTFHVLHVSDIHNNVAAFSFMREVASQFKIDVIVDTGDITDFGSPFEAGIGREIARLPYPYVIVLGNHDSPEVAKTLSGIANVTLLEDKPITVKGLTLIGLPNPAAARPGLEGINVTPEEMQINQTKLLEAVRQQPTLPDIVAVHDPRQSALVWGRVPLVLCGHMHREYIEEQLQPPAGAVALPGEVETATSLTASQPMTTVVCNAGTTGAAGTRYFDKKGGVPLTCAVITFRRLPAIPSAENIASVAEPRLQLRAITLITLDGRFDQYSLSHRSFSPPNDSPASTVDTR